MARWLMYTLVAIPFSQIYLGKIVMMPMLFAALYNAYLHIIDIRALDRFFLSRDSYLNDD